MRIGSVSAQASVPLTGPLSRPLQRALAEQQMRLIPASEIAQVLASGAPRLPTAALASLEAALDDGDHGFKQLGLSGPATAGALAALESSRALAKTLSREVTFNAHYFFTNEAGLYEAASRVGPRGGAAVGVSGGLLDIAARTRADLVVSMDASAAMKDFFDLVSSVLLAVDEKIRAGTLPEVKRAPTVQWLLSPIPPKEHDTEVAHRLEFLAGSGLDGAKVYDLMKSLEPHRGATNWLTAPDVADNVRHLTHLAREGRIVAISIDITDPVYPATVRSVLAAYGAPLATLNLSNLLDYVRERWRVSSNLAQLVDVARSDAVVFNTVFQGANYFPAEVRPIVGSFAVVGVGPFARWADPSDLTAHYDRLFPDEDIG